MRLTRLFCARRAVIYSRSSIAEEISKVIRPDLKVLLILTGYTKHLCNHSDGQRVGKLSHELHLGLRERLVQECINDLLNTRAHSLNHVWRELLIQEFAQAAVMWRIEKEHPLGKDLVERCEFALHFAWERSGERVAALTGETGSCRPASTSA